MEAPTPSGGGYVLSAPGFEPPTTKADENTLSSKADSLYTLAGKITGRGDNLLRSIETGATHYSDLVSSKIREAGGYNEAASKKAAQGAIWGGTVTDEYASNVMQYKTKISALVNEYIAAEADNFGLDPDMAPNPRAAQTQVDGKKADFMARAQKLYEHFKDQASDRGRELKDGPTKERLRELAETNEMMWFSPALFANTGDAPPNELNKLIKAGILPQSFRFMDAEAARKYLLKHPELIKELRKNPLVTSPDADPAVAALAMAVPLNAKNGGSRASAAKVRAAFAKMSKSDRKWMAILFPDEVGNLNGAPFAQRADANLLRVADEYRIEQGHEGDKRGREDLYKSILDNDRQIIYFDPDLKGENGKDPGIAELHGPITGKTQNVGIFVPGTGAGSDDFNGRSETSAGFQQKSGGKLSMITWIGGDMPDDMSSDAPFNSYAKEAAPLLADFSKDVRDEIALQGSDAKIAVAGHSYGGATVGVAETKGLDADRIMHIESAGMGAGVESPDDYDHPERPRYTMTNPNDPVQYAQEADNVRNGISSVPIVGPLINWGADSKLDDLGHGADPDGFEGAYQLDAGKDAGGKEYSNPHSGVFNKGSDGWRNIYGFYSDGEMKYTNTPDPEDMVPAPGHSDPERLHRPYQRLPVHVARSARQVPGRPRHLATGNRNGYDRGTTPGAALEFAVNPQQAAAAAEQSDAAAGELGSVRQQFASIVERAAEASGDLGIKGRCLAYHDEWSRVITEIEHRGSTTGTDLAAVTAEAVRTGDEVAGDFGSVAADASGINRAING